MYVVLAHQLAGDGGHEEDGTMVNKDLLGPGDTENGKGFDIKEDDAAVVVTVGVT